ncbi:MAG: serine/threonine-protein kinase [bacterium]
MEQLGKYSIKKKLGEGGFGAVYLAEDNIGREVALKVLHPQVAQDEMLSGYFRREAVALGRLSHPNIVLIHNFDQEEGKTYIVMEYVDGPTLAKMLQRRGVMPVDDTLAIFVQVLRALGHAHSKGVVHRDIKPGNIMLTEAGQVKVGDFGIARVTGTEKLTKTGTGAGSLLYMSPEQINGKGVDQRSDIYSLGATLYQMLTGSTPFQGDSDYEIMTKQLNEPPPPLRDLRGELPPALEAIVLKALAKKQSDRYQTAEEMAAALELLRSSGQVSLDEEELSERTRMTISDLRRPEETVVASPPKVGGNKSLLYIVGGAIGVIAIALAIIFWPSSPEQPVEEQQQMTVADTVAQDTAKVSSVVFSDSLRLLSGLFARREYTEAVALGGALAESQTAGPEDSQRILQYVTAAQLMLGAGDRAKVGFERLKRGYRDVEFSPEEFPREVITAWEAFNSAPVSTPTVTIEIEKWDLYERLMVELDGKRERYTGKPLPIKVGSSNKVYEMRLVTETEMFTDTVRVGSGDRTKFVQLGSIGATVRIAAQDVDDPLAFTPAKIFVDGKLAVNPSDGSELNTTCDIVMAQGPHKVEVEFEGYRSLTGAQYVHLQGDTKLGFQLKGR